MGTEIKRNLPNDEYQAAINANAPTGANPFATMADVTGGGETLAATLALGNTTGVNNVIIDETQYIQFQNNDVTGNARLRYNNTVAGPYILDLPTHSGTLMTDLVDDTTPQLGGALAVSGFKIVSVANGNIDIEPNGTGNVLLGNLTFDADQVVGPGQDNYVLTYDDATGLIGLEVATGTAYIFSTGLTDAAGTITNNLSTGIAGGQNIYGGTAASEILTISSTTDATKGRIQLGVSLTDVVNIGSSYSAGQKQLRVGTSKYVDIGFHQTGAGPGSSYVTGIWANQATPDSTNYILAHGQQGASPESLNLNVPAVGILAFRMASSNVIFTYNASLGSAMTWTPINGGLFTAGGDYIFNSSIKTGLVSAKTCFHLNMAPAYEYAGAVALQTDFLITPKTHTFTGANTLTDGYTMYIAGAPISGINAVITNSVAFGIAAGNVAGAGTVTNSYGLIINAQTGATNNYGSAFMGGNVGILTLTPNSSLQVSGSFSLPIRAVAAADSFSSTDYTLEASGAAAYNVTLPTAVGISGRIYLLKNVSGSDKTLVTTSSQTIDGALTRAVTATNFIKVQSNGANWIIIG